MRSVAPRSSAAFPASPRSTPRGPSCKRSARRAMSTDRASPRSASMWAPSPARSCAHDHRRRADITLPLWGRGGGIVVERSVPMAGAVELVLNQPPSAAAIAPGQFFQLAVGAPHTILRRPYSAAWSDPAAGRIGFIFNVVGAGSAWLSGRDMGSELDLLS